ncbi:hypothetical protein AHAS_Ahas11G0071300 [Arachis hypogaea]
MLGGSSIPQHQHLQVLLRRCPLSVASSPSFVASSPVFVTNFLSSVAHTQISSHWPCKR